MTEIQGKSILVRVSARFELSGVDWISTFCTLSGVINNYNTDLFANYYFYYSHFRLQRKDKATFI